MVLNDRFKYTDREIMEKGSEALIREIGYTGFLRFIHQIEQGEQDYLKIQDELYKDMNLDEVYEKAIKHWEKK
ncbi:MAG: hypothetical protein RO469_07060 [Thermincola sp.]|jgi:uncharacterized protein YfbU (UPF0304 family)|nr:hypothetical protein [Thermincola sp.]MDT3702612.1 hypothetical protein [Thermincola sp.]